MKRQTWRMWMPMTTLLALAPGCQPLFTPCSGSRDGALTIEPEFLRAEVRSASASPPAAAPPSYRGTETLDQARSKLEVAAIRLTDACWGATPAGSDCASWTSDLEAAFSAAGYKVVPTSDLQRVELGKNVSTLDAAEELGVDVLFLLDRLEVAEISGAAAAPNNITFFRSNRHGERLEATTPDAAAMTDLREYIGGQVTAPAAGPNVTGITSAVDGTAILIEKGAKIWFFTQNTVRALPPMESGVNFLFGRYPTAPTAVESERWEPMDPEPLAGETIPVASHGAGPAISYDGAAAPPNPTGLPTRQQLIREQAQALVAAFGGRQ